MIHQGAAPVSEQRFRVYRITSVFVVGCRLKDGREVEPRDGVVMTTDDSSYRLVIREARDSDAGVYKCLIRNTAGETACTATLSVNGRPHYKSCPSVRSSVGHWHHHDYNNRGACHWPAEIKVLVFKKSKFCLGSGLDRKS